MKIKKSRIIKFLLPIGALAFVITPTFILASCSSNQPTHNIINLAVSLEGDGANALIKQNSNGSLRFDASLNFGYSLSANDQVEMNAFNNIRTFLQSSFTNFFYPLISLAKNNDLKFVEAFFKGTDPQQYLIKSKLLSNTWIKGSGVFKNINQVKLFPKKVIFETKGTLSNVNLNDSIANDTAQNQLESNFNFNIKEVQFGFFDAFLDRSISEVNLTFDQQKEIANSIAIAPEEVKPFSIFPNDKFVFSYKSSLIKNQSSSAKQTMYENGDMIKQTYAIAVKTNDLSETVIKQIVPEIEIGNYINELNKYAIEMDNISKNILSFTVERTKIFQQIKDLFGTNKIFKF